jgi:hypothetical protein
MLLDDGKRMRLIQQDYEDHTVGLLGATKTMVRTCWSAQAKQATKCRRPGSGLAFPGQTMTAK